MGDFIKKFFDIKFLKFVMVGVLNTIVGMGLQFLLFNLFGIEKNICTLIGNVIGSILSYFLNKYFTFKNTEKGWKPVFRFALNIAVCYVLAYSVVMNIVSYICTANSISMFNMSIESFSANFSMLVGACSFVAFNYIGQRFFAFKEKNEDK
ncbi:MAG: GtrA family protein [Ruminococcus sp.]|nr:GtrA family protein [Ruminococcus sp.]